MLMVQDGLAELAYYYVTSLTLHNLGVEYSGTFPRYVIGVIRVYVNYVD